MTVQDLVDGYVDALSESGENSIPMASADPDEVIRSQLTENTGRHLLDSGGAYGRNWEENQDNPPWEKPAWTVEENWVNHNVYDFMSRRYDRDSAAVALEIGLYAFGHHGPAKRDSWLSTMKQYAEMVGRPEGVEVLTEEAGLPRHLAQQAIYAVDGTVDSPMSWNTYNGEWHSLSQVLQGVNFGGPYSEFAMIQVHGGCDVRGGYTAPRVYSSFDGWIPGELSYYCPECKWSNAESVIGYEDPHLVWISGVVDWPDIEEKLEKKEYDATEEAMKYALERAWDDDTTDGAVFHLCGDGELGYVRF